MRYRVHLTKPFPSTKEALTWLRADIARLKRLPLSPKGWLEDRPRWEVIEAGNVILKVDEWGKEAAA